MPPASKSSSLNRKSGITKAKGTARAKSGCYTCRIRRKKCDEQKSERGNCKTCDRLRLECLGYGVKRPEWLRSSQAVSDIRDRIKKFLASQGLIKGHSSPASRSVEQELSILQLRPECHSSPESDSMSGYHRSPSPGPTYIGSPREPWGTYDAPYSVPSNQSSDGSTFMQVSKSSTMTGLVTSESCYFDDQIPDDNTQCTYPLIAMLPPTFYPINTLALLATYYENYVFEMQYFLARKPATKQIVLGSLQSHPISTHIIRILSDLHYGKRRLPQHNIIDHIPPIIYHLTQVGSNTLDDAMAVLHSVTVYLFNGGEGAWEDCIAFAASHVQSILAKSSLANPLPICDAKTAFVIKTAIWFDVLASITTQEPPRMRGIINQMFNPCGSQVRDVGSPQTDQCSMLTPMGCENDVVWAISEISALASWKRKQRQKGYLSIPELVKKARFIEQYLDNPVYSQPCRDTDTALQYSASGIFRAAARLYLATVLSGDYPLVADVRSRTQETYNALRAIPNHSMVRSTVFGFFLCGCFSTDSEEQRFIKNALLLEEESVEIGNCKAIVTLLDAIWSKYTEHTQPIPWRDELKDRHILLV
ncbi:hypothetical protein AX17_002322 [Amanita inopinata Kibby_2008]|nr:hypothetical protein AX17_002322 [Amanita inopinata Kibby_2008]